MCLNNLNVLIRCVALSFLSGAFARLPPAAFCEDGSAANAVAAALEAMALTRLSDVPVRMLSTGQRKRAMLARVIASGAPIWLLDEPGNGLDSASLGLLGSAVSAHLAGGGIVVTASHQPLPLGAPVVLSLADHLPDPAEWDA